MKNKVGVYVAGDDSKIGSIFVGIVSVSPNYFRNTYNSKDDKIDLEKLEHFYAIKIRPEDINKKAIIRSIADCLNSYKEFWKHDITIGYNEASKEDIVSSFNSKLKKDVDLNEDKWRFTDSSKMIDFAKKIFESYRDEEKDYLKKIYGAFETEEEFVEKYKDAPYVRKK